MSGRYAIARFNLEALGRPSHAGARLSEGRSAIRIMADMIPMIEQMTSESCTFSVGVIHGGQWVNCVSTTCTGEALSMAKRQADLDQGVAAMLGLRASSNEVKQFQLVYSIVQCCMGGPPKVQERVFAFVPDDKHAPNLSGMQVTVTGTLHVNPTKSNGETVSGAPGLA